MHERFWEKLTWGISSGCFVYVVGKPRVGRNELAHAVREKLQARGHNVEVLSHQKLWPFDDDIILESDDQIKDNLKSIIKRMGKILARNNVITLVTINPDVAELYLGNIRAGLVGSNNKSN